MILSGGEMVITGDQRNVLGRQMELLDGRKQFWGGETTHSGARNHDL